MSDAVFVICEAGVSNYGELDLALRQVDAAVDAGADAVKFQAWETASLVSRRAAAEHAPELGYDWFERMDERRLDWDELRTVRAYAAARGILWFATAHDLAALDFLVGELDVALLKVGSGEAGNLDFLARVGAARKPVHIAFGLQSDEEASRAVRTLRAAGAPEVTAFHTVSVYPTPAELVDLHRLGRLRKALGVPVGISDHSVGRHVVLAAVALGAAAVEKHLTFDRADPGSLDNPGALEPDEWVTLVREIRELEVALREPDPERLEQALAGSRDWASQAIVAARDLPAGRVLTRDDLEFKRPARGGIPVSEVDHLLGRTLRRPIRADEQLQYDALETSYRET